MTSLLILALIAIGTAGLMVGNEIAVGVFVHPKLWTLDNATHLRAAQPLARIFGGLLKPTCNFLPPGMQGYQEIKPCPQGDRPDLNRARQLIRENKLEAINDANRRQAISAAPRLSPHPARMHTTALSRLA